MSDPPPVFHGDKGLAATIVKKKFPRVLAITNKSVTRTQQIIIELTRKGFVVETAIDQRTAIRKWKYPGYHDLLLIDFNLGDHTFDGNYLASAIRKAESQEQYTSKAQKEQREKLLRLVSTHTNASKEELRAKMLGEGVQRTTIFGLWDSADEYKKMCDLRVYDALIRHPLDVHIQYLQETFVSSEELKKVEDQPSTEQMISLLATTHVNRLPGDTVTNFLATTGTLSGKGNGRKALLSEGNDATHGFKYQGVSLSSSILPQTNAVRQIENQLTQAEDALKDEKSARLECERLTDEAHAVSRQLRAELMTVSEERNSLKEKVDSLESLIHQRTNDVVAHKKEFKVLSAMMKSTTSFTRPGETDAVADAKQLVEENSRLREENFEVNSKLHSLKVNLRHGELKYSKLKEKYEQTRKMLNKAFGQNHPFSSNVTSPPPSSPKISEVNESVNSEGVGFGMDDAVPDTASETKSRDLSTCDSKLPARGLARLRNSVTKISTSLKVAKSVLSPEQLQEQSQFRTANPNMRGLSFYSSNPSFVQKIGQTSEERIARKVLIRQREKHEIRIMELHDEMSRIAVRDNFFARGLMGPGLGLPPPIDHEEDQSSVDQSRAAIISKIQSALQPPKIGEAQKVRHEAYEPKLRRKDSPQVRQTPSSVLTLTKVRTEQELTTSHHRQKALMRPTEAGSMYERTKDGIFQEWEATGRVLASLEAASRYFSVTKSLTMIAELHSSGGMSAAVQQIAKGRKKRQRGLTSKGAKSSKSPERSASAKRVTKEEEAMALAEAAKETENAAVRRKQLEEAEESANKDLGAILRTPMLRQYIKNRILANGNVKETDDYHIESTYQEVFDEFKQFLEEVLHGYKRLIADIVTDMMRLFYKETSLLDLKERAMFEQSQLSKSPEIRSDPSHALSDSDNSEFHPGKSTILGRSSMGSVNLEGPTSPLKRQVSPPSAGFSTVAGGKPISGAPAGAGRPPVSSKSSGLPQQTSTRAAQQKSEDILKAETITSGGLVPGSLTPHHQVIHHLSKHFHHVIRQGTKTALDLHLQYLERFSKHASISIDVLNRLVLPLVHQVEGGKKEGNIRHVRVNFAQTDPVTLADQPLDSSASRRESLIGSDVGSMWSSGPFTPGIHAPRRPSLQATGTDFTQSISTRSPVQRATNSRSGRSPPNHTARLSKSTSGSGK